MNHLQVKELSLSGIQSTRMITREKDVVKEGETQEIGVSPRVKAGGGALVGGEISYT